MAEFAGSGLSFLSKYSHLDPFQLEAFRLVDSFSGAQGGSESQQENILVTAHTGSGKSLIAEYGIYKNVVVDRKRVIYTSPIKSLSNQKFYDFNKKFEEFGISVGILTGDIKYAPQADCLIMTTEILLNLLIKYMNNPGSGSELELYVDFSSVGCVVFDEVHYINDKDRGTIWEQSIMHVPPHVQLILLSATLNEPQKFGDWISSVQHKPTRLLSTTRRVVPLYFSLYYAYSLGLVNKLAKDKKDMAPLFNRLLTVTDTNSKRFDEELYMKIVKYNDYYLNVAKQGRWEIKSVINEMLRKFYEDLSNGDELNMFPVQLFVLNKRRCGELAKNLNIDFNTPKESLEVEAFVSARVREMKLFYLEPIPQFQTMLRLARRGVGVHHSGLLPLLKEMVEMLYQGGLIKVLFATETFAVGLNMPTKTVVFTDVFKFSGSYRQLYSHEFIQMAGRAGRRNIDTVGYVVLLPQLFREGLTVTEMKSMLSGGGQRIESQMDIDALLVMRIVQDGMTVADLVGHIRNSLLASDNRSQIAVQTRLVRDLREAAAALAPEDARLVETYRKLAAPMTKLSQKQVRELNQLKSDKKFTAKLEVAERCRAEEGVLAQLEGYLDQSASALLREIEQLVQGEGEGPGRCLRVTVKGALAKLISTVEPIVVLDIVQSQFFQRLDCYNVVTLLSSLVFEDRPQQPASFYSVGAKAYDGADATCIVWFDFLAEYAQHLEESSPYLRQIFDDMLNLDHVWLLDEFVRTGRYSSLEEVRCI